VSTATAVEAVKVDEVMARVVHARDIVEGRAPFLPVPPETVPMMQLLEGGPMACIEIADALEMPGQYAAAHVSNLLRPLMFLAHGGLVAKWYPERGDRSLSEWRRMENRVYFQLTDAGRAWLQEQHISDREDPPVDSVTPET
jgi:hypothetical protein